MATLDDLKGVLESIDTTMKEQKTLLVNMLSAQATRDRLSSVNTSVANQVSTGQSIGAAASGIGSGIGSAAAGLGLGGLAALAGMEMFANFDAQAIKDNVVTLLSISDEVGGKAEMLKEGGTFFLAMTGLAAGLAAFGVGQTLVGLGQWITDDQWTKTLKSNVVDLLSIADEVGGNLNFLYEGGTVGLALGGLGMGLTAFGVGQSLVGLGQWITDTDWAEKVKENVKTLLSIKDDLGGTEVLFAGAAFPIAMTGLGIGLSTFAVGNAAVGLAQFISSDDWAQKVKDSVETLLSISELPGVGWNTTEFVGVMGGIALGLTAFALGKGAATVVEGAAEAISFFTGDPFADKIKSEVETLLSIPQMEGVGADTVKFIGVMAGIATGLTAFALGKGAATVVEGASEALAYFTGDEPFADRIKSEVATLMSITELTDEGKAIAFTSAMGQLSEGLSSFAGGNFVGTLKNAGTAIISFFFGTESPFEQIRGIYENADKLVAGAGALDKLQASLDKIGGLKFDGSNLNIKAFAEDLAESIPVIESAIMGGTIEKFGLFNDLEFKGLASADIDYGTAIKNIKNLREALGMAAEESPVVSANSERIRMERANQSITDVQKRLETVAMGNRAATVTAISNNGNTTYAPVNIKQTKSDINVQAKTFYELSTRYNAPSGVQ